MSGLRVTKIVKEIKIEGLKFEVFQEFFASINKIFILAGRLVAGLYSMELRHFPDIS